MCHFVTATAHIFKRKNINYNINYNAWKMRDTYIRPKLQRSFTQNTATYMHMDGVSEINFNQGLGTSHHDKLKHKIQI